MDLAYMENEATCFQIPFTWRNETFFRTCPLHQQILLVFPAKFVQFQPLTHPPLHYIKSWFWSFLHTVLEIRRRLPLFFPAELSLAVLLLSLLPNSLHLLFFTSRLCDSVRMRSVVSDSLQPRTAACQVPLSMGFSREENWSGLPFPSSGDHPNPGIDLYLLRCGQILYRLNHQMNLLTNQKETHRLRGMNLRLLGGRDS